MQPISSSSSSRHPPQKSQPPPPTGERRIDVDAVRKVVSSRAYNNRFGSHENMPGDEQQQQPKAFGQPKAFVPKDVSGTSGGKSSSNRSGGGSSGGGMISSTAHPRVNDRSGTKNSESKDDRNRGYDHNNDDNSGVGVSESSWLAMGPRKFLGGEEDGGSQNAVGHHNEHATSVSRNRSSSNNSQPGSSWKDAHPSPQHSIHSEGTGSNPNSPTPNKLLQQQQQQQHEGDDGGDIKDTDYFESTFHKLSVPKGDFIISKETYNPPALTGRENRLSDVDDIDGDIPAVGSSEASSPESMLH